jgi:hypothetical protein
VCAALAACVPEWRWPRVRHRREDLVRQRVLQIACGYADQDDADALRADPLLKHACGRLPESGPGLASQPRGRTGIVLASRDRYFPAGDPDVEPPDFEWDAAGANRLDERVSAFFATAAPPVVRAIRADAVGSLMLRLTGGWSLAVFPDDSLGEEHWRFFAPGSKHHLVVTGKAIE